VRILHISTRLILGGSQENTVLSCEGQSQRGHEVHLAFGPIYGPEGSLLDRVQRFATSDGRGIASHEVPDLVREVSPWRDARCLMQLRNLVRELRPDVVHTHSSKAGILGRVAAWQVRRALGKPLAVVHTIHGPPFMPAEGSPAQRAKTLASNAMYTLAEFVAAKHCHAIYSVADAMTRQYLARGIGEEGLYRTVRSGMEVRSFLHAAAGEDRASMRRAMGLGEHDFVIGTVARLAQHKGHEDILACVARLRREAPAGVRPVLLWVGDGWLREMLVRRAADLGLRSREAFAREHASTPHADILLTGLVPPERVPAMLRAMDVLAHPSSREGLPRTVPQALLAGVCPVAYDVDGTREACIDMRFGRLVPHADVAALADALLWCMRNPEHAKGLAVAGQAWSAHEFAASTMVERLEIAYAAALRRAAEDC
jgi:glycosyltransferase involved in cell wall biosynthesis